MKSDPKRLKNFEKFQINKDLLKKTGRTTYFLHCLTAHRGCEVTDEIIDGENSLVWAEAENRLYAHQSILLWCLKKISTIFSKAVVIKVLKLEKVLIFQ